MKYVCLLRGINISGKNKIPMKELKLGFEELNYKKVITYINSGNVIFSSEKNREIVTDEIKQMIKNKFDLDIPIYVTTIDELKDVIKNIPDWFGSNNKNIYNNIIFIIPPTTYREVFNEIGAANNYEKIENYKNVIYWSFILKSYSKTNWINTASSSINDNITMRTYNTIKKIIELGNRR